MIFSKKLGKCHYHSIGLITRAKKKKTFFKTRSISFIYSGVEIFPKHDVTFRFSMNETVFPWLYVETSGVSDFVGFEWNFDK